ncbi:hypothetical protein GcM3_168002 [Golovinomyces cichoracearum]|uniref:Ubiquinol-cytochrome-c reductase complex assembly factor 2 n=1 Tax=Golovinomyces cichoracearum TaxID=62708 RepID=A0A420HRT5_9PEZI|nr:hypothetical protein GcM3_168002 [Golovinomyces cichoracearum]
MSKSIPYQHYLRALSQWPRDALRPECQFKDIVRRRVDKMFLSNPHIESPNSTPGKTRTEINEKKELEQVNALYLILENRFSQRYPIKGSMMKPESNPSYYSDLVNELETAPSRGLWDRIVKKCKGMLRFS